MIALDLPPPLWVPAAPAIIRPVESRLQSPGYLPLSRHLRRAALSELVGRGIITREQARDTLAFLAPAGFVKATTGLPDLTYDDQVASTTDLTTYQFVDRPIGKAKAGRVVFVVAHVVTGSTRTLTAASSSIVGVTPTKIVERSFGTAWTLTLLTAVVAAGDTGTIDLTYSGACQTCSIKILSARDLVSATATDFDSAEDAQSGDADPVTVALTVLAGGFVIGAAIKSGSTVGYTWGGDFTEHHDDTIDGSTPRREGTASATGLAADAAYAATVTPDGNAIVSMIAASYR